MKEHLQELKLGGRPKRKWEIELEEKDTEIERLHSIIKEVREKLNTQLAFTSSYQLNYQSAMSIIEQAKQILDKESE